MLSLCKSSAAVEFTTVYSVIFGTTMLVLLLGGIPLMSKCWGISDSSLLLIGIAHLLFIMAGGVVVYWLDYQWFGYVIAYFFGVTFMISPLINGIVSTYLSKREQGVGLGVLHSAKGITASVGPYMFAGLYQLLKDNGYWVTLPFMIGILFASMAIPIWIKIRNLVALKNATKELITDDKKSFAVSENGADDYVINYSKEEGISDSLGRRDTFE